MVLTKGLNYGWDQDVIPDKSIVFPKNGHSLRWFEGSIPSLDNEAPLHLRQCTTSCVQTLFHRESTSNGKGSKHQEVLVSYLS